jgi:hypothetical protein
LHDEVALAEMFNRISSGKLVVGTAAGAGRF